MKAILDRDIIVSLTPKGNIEIGTIPPEKRGVIGLERLRFDGTKIVDLADLSEFWVEAVAPDFFVLHCIKVPGSQQVVMTYQDRIHLMIENGLIRLKTPLEITAETDKMEKTIIKNRLRQAFKKDIGGPEDALADAWKIITLLIIYIRTGEPTIATFLDSIMPDLEAAYPLATVKDRLTANAKTIRTLMEGYYQEIQTK